MLEMPPGTGCASLQRALHDRFKVELPIDTWYGRTLMRITVQCYNTQEDLVCLFDRLEAAVGPAA